jgi:hypothetical protein
MPRVKKNGCLMARKARRAIHPGYKCAATGRWRRGFK